MSWQNTLLTWSLRRWVKPNSLLAQDIAASRAMTSKAPFRAKLPAGWRLRTESTGEWIEPPEAGTSCILYLHGGGYTTMAPRSYRSITSRLAVLSETRLFALDYRLAPEHPFPAALDDALAAYRALAATGARVVVAGDSAGGGLALALLVALRDQGDRLPIAAVLFSPWTDLAATGDSITTNSASDALMVGARVGQMATHYLGPTPATNKLASPLYADLTGLPPLLIQVSDTEVLLDDSRRLAAKAQGAGVDVTLRIWAGLPHVWQYFAPILPEGKAALRQAGDFISERLAAHPGGTLADGPVPGRGVPALSPR